MKNLLYLFLLSGGLCFVSCESEGMHQHDEETIDLVALRAQLQSMEDAYAKGQNAKDADAVVAYYADDAVSLPQNKPMTVGKSAILALTKEEIAADTTTSNVRFEVVDVYAQSNLAVEVGRSITTNADGSESTGKYISVFENRDGKWICIRDCYNNDAPEN